MTELKYLDITKAGDGHIKVPSIGLTSPAITESIAKTALASFSDGAEGIPVKSLIADINPVQTGSGDPSPSNVRPITGWTGMNVVRNGFNQWDEEWENGYYNRATGAKAGNSDTKYFRSKNYIPCLPNTSYYFKSPSSHAANNTYFAVLFYDADKAHISSANDLAGDPTKTTPSNARYMTIYVEVGTSGATYNHDISINYPSTDHDYHAYNGTTYPISWADEAGTVYGGTLDVTTGLLTVDRASVVVSSLGLNYNAPPTGHAYFYGTIADKVKPAINDTEHPLMCSMLPYGGAKYASSFTDLAVFQSANYNIYIVDDSCANKAAYEAKYNNAQIVYYLDTPTTYQLTPQAVLTVLGTNNILADTGDVEVAYCADTKLYIDKVLTE